MAELEDNIFARRGVMEDGRDELRVRDSSVQLLLVSAVVVISAKFDRVQLARVVAASYDAALRALVAFEKRDPREVKKRRDRA